MNSAYTIIQNYKQFTNHGIGVKMVCTGGKGVYLFDSESNKYLDFSCGWGVASYGYNNPIILESIRQQLEINTYAPPWLITPESTELAAKLIKITGLSGYKCMRATGGSDSIEIALRICQAARPGKIISLEKSYHGSSRLLLDVGDNSVFSKNQNLNSNVIRLEIPHKPYAVDNDYDEGWIDLYKAALSKTLETNNISCVVLEPIVGSGGIFELPTKYLSFLSQSCKDHNIPLILDEVVTGFGRTGSLFAFHNLPIKPDILCLAKGMTGGYAACGAVLCRSELLKRHNENFSDISPSFAWTPLACRTALSCINFLQEHIELSDIESEGEYLKNNLETIFRKKLPNFCGEVRGRGYMIGVELLENNDTRRSNPSLGAKLFLKLKNKGLCIALDWSSSILTFLPPLIATRNEMDECLSIVDSAL